MLVSIAGRWLPVIVLLVALGVPAAAAPAPASTGGSSNTNQTSAEKIRKALDQAITFDFAKTNLDEVLKVISDQTKVHFVVDRGTIQLMGFEGEFEVTLKVQDVPVRTALRRLLGQYNLGYVIVDNSVVVTTEEMALYRQVRQRVNVDLNEIPLQTALKQLGRETATNLLVDKKVAKEAQMPLTLQLDDVPLEIAVRLMTQMVGLKMVRVGNVLFVTNKATADELKADQETPLPGQPGYPGPVQERVIIGGGIGAAPVPAPAPPAQPAKPAEEKPKEDKPPER